jgi:NAD(P)-dependent dehydrogenase (short-subunit alcohol dehydrogenase family)
MKTITGAATREGRSDLVEASGDARLMPAVSYDFAGLTAVVIGASRGGIGAAIARALQDAGAEVHITGVEETCAPEDADRFAYTQLDVTDTGAVRAYAAALPRVDILVNCAAITRRGEEMAPEFFSHVLDVNLTGTFRCAEAMHPALKAAKGRNRQHRVDVCPFRLPPEPGLRVLEGRRGATDEIARHRLGGGRHPRERGRARASS